MPDVTQILNAIDAGDRQAADQLMPLVYDELRKLAAVKMAQERPDHSLDATALVHEAYLRLVGARSASKGDKATVAGAAGSQPGSQRFDNRGHFFAAAAEAMRRILVDRARERHSLKRGGKMDRVPLSDFANSDPDERLLHLDEALTRLATTDPLAAKAVELHHFAGLTQDDAAAALGISDYQFRQKWAFARAWLKAELSDF